MSSSPNRGVVVAKSSKWLVISNPEQPVTRIARRVLRQRLKVLSRLAPDAASHPEEIEHAHQLRVATRRAQAITKLFSDLLPRKETRRLNKVLKRLRQAAGDARDLDVLGQRLSRDSHERPAARLELLIDAVGQLRATAQAPLARGVARVSRRKFKTRCRALVKHLEWPHGEPEPPFSDAVRQRLSPLVEEFFLAASQDLSSIRALHKMRVSAKQVRYCLELAVGECNERFRAELYPVFEELQENLGAINDHVKAVSLLSKILETSGAAEVQIAARSRLAAEQQQFDAARARFLAWWTEARKTQLRQRFDEFFFGPSLSASNAADAVDTTSRLAAGE